MVEEVGHLADPAAARLVPGAAQAVRDLGRAGFLIVVASNQAAVAKGIASPGDVAAVEERIAELLETEAPGAFVDKWYYCFHHPHGTVTEFTRVCDCRKPAPGMLLEAAVTDRIDLGASYMVGNMYHDVLAGDRAGARAILVDTTPEMSAADPTRDEAESLIWRRVDDLAGAVREILATNTLDR